MGYADVDAAREKLMKDAEECGYDLTERSDSEDSTVEFLAEMFMFQEVNDDTLEMFRTGELRDGTLNPNADYGEFFTEAFYSEFELITDRHPNAKELDLFDDEVVKWVRFHAKEEKKALEKEATNDDVEYPEEAFRAFV